MSIVVIGLCMVDIKGYPLTLYIPAGRNAGRVSQVHGGVGRNIAEDIANLELRPVFVSVVDEGGLSMEVLDKLKRHKVNTNYIRKAPDGLGTWLAVFDHNGDVVASISKRPDDSAILDTLREQGDEIIKNADSVLVEVDMNPDIVGETIRLAEKYNKPLYAVVSNMSIAMERRDLLKKTACTVCNQQEAGMLFSEDYEHLAPQELAEVLSRKIRLAQIPRMVITMGENGSVYASLDGEKGWCPPIKIDVIDTTGAGDAFFAGVAVGLTYHKTLAEACSIGTRLASSVIATKENVCPRYLPEEFGITP